MENGDDAAGVGLEPRLLRLAVRADVGVVIYVPLAEPLPWRGSWCDL